MRKLNAHVHIQAPIQTVRQLADSDRAQWMITRPSILRDTLHESWEVVEMDGGTRFTLRLEYRTRLPFLEPLLADGFHHSVTQSLSRLKQIAETTSPGVH